MNSKAYNYGEVIRRHRVELGLTQRQVADRCGITDSALAHIEREKRLPSEVVASRIARALQFTREVRAEFEAGLKAARENQARERVRSRRTFRPILGNVEPNGSRFASELANDFKSIRGLQDGCQYLRAALQDQSQREPILRALKAWAGKN